LAVDLALALRRHYLGADGSPYLRGENEISLSMVSHARQSEREILGAPAKGAGVDRARRRALRLHYGDDQSPPVIHMATMHIQLSVFCP
jgi:hypothetical protein